MKTLLIEPRLCIRCTNCQIACKDEHCGIDRLPVAAAQPEGQFWIKIQEKETGSGERVRLERTPVSCMHCKNPLCMAACPNDAIYQRDDGLVIIDPKKCEGCGECAKACPYGVIYFNEELAISQKCTGCAHLMDAGWERPRCVNACPTDALSWVDTDDLSPENLVAPLEKMKPEAGSEPRVSYVRPWKPFVAGSVWSPSENKSLEGVHVAVRSRALGMSAETVTNNYGDFSVEDLEPGFYEMTLCREGYYPKTIRRLDIRQGLNVGDIVMSPMLGAKA